MTIEKDRFIKIPIWLVVVVLPITIALITAYGINKATNAKIQQQIEQQEKELEKKADKATMDYVQGQLDRIEKKIDDHMSR